MSTAEETEAASEVVLDTFTPTAWWSWGVINAFTLEHFKCINNFIRLMFYIFFLNIQINVETKSNDTFKYEWVSEWVSDATRYGDPYSEFVLCI